jgi:hypothetical protein
LLVTDFSFGLSSGSLIIAHSRGKFTPHTGHTPLSPLYFISKYCMTSTSQFQQIIFLKMGFMGLGFANSLLRITFGF